MRTQISLGALAFLTACGITQPEDQHPSALDIAIPVGDGQSVFAVPNGATDPIDGGLFKIADQERPDGQNIEAIPFECFDPKEPEAAIEKLAQKFIRYAEGTTVDEKLAELQFLKIQAQDWYAEICHDL